MGYPLGFTYVSGPVFMREFNVASAATFKANNPVVLNGAGNIVESLATMQTIAGFANHDAANSVPPGKVLVMVPTERAIFSGIVAAGLTASTLSSGVTLGHTKTGNYFYLTSAATSTATAIYVVVPREDGSTLDSTDSSVWVQVIGNQTRPHHLNVPTQVI